MMPQFTGKERDTETGLDYFGARYYGSNMGRFLTPDWSATPTPIPFANVASPQTLNLYSYVNNNPLNRIDPLGHNWFNIDGTWKWYKGENVTEEGKSCKKGTAGCLHSDYTDLLVAEKTGVDKKTGATLFKLTLYDQKTKVFEGSGFSGGMGQPSILSGNYTIRTDIRDMQGPNAPNPASRDNNPPPYFGLQRIDRTLNPYMEQVFQAYGPTRARLNPWSGEDHGDYFHGQYNGFGWTHGCLSYGTDTRFIDWMWNSPPQKLPVAVDMPVVKP